MKLHSDFFAAVAWIRSTDNPIQLLVIQPVDRAVVAVIDNDVARAAVEMGIHEPAAVRTADPAIQLFPVRGMHRVRGGRTTGAEILHNLQEDIHRNEHPAAPAAVQDWTTGD